eukprot:c29775_g1_i1 orf=2-202(-)
MFTADLCLIKDIMSSRLSYILLLIWCSLDLRRFEEVLHVPVLQFKGNKIALFYYISAACLPVGMPQL